MTKKTLPKSTSIRWYRIKESTLEKIVKLTENIKFWENNNWTEKNNAKKKGAKIDDDLGIKKTSLVNSLTKSNPIWKEPLRPIKVGPIRRCEYAKNFLSVRTVNNVNNKDKIARIIAKSLMVLKQKIIKTKLKLIKINNIAEKIKNMTLAIEKVLKKNNFCSGISILL